MKPIEFNGRKLYTGLQMPEVRPRTFARLGAVTDLPSRDEIIDRLRDPNRTRARQLFPGKDYTKDQGNSNSCNGEAGAGALERARVKRGLPHVKLSGEFLYAIINGGQNNGSQLDAAMVRLISGGTCEERLVRSEEYLLSRISAEAKANAARYRAFECLRVDSEIELAAGIALGWVGVVAVQVRNTDYLRIDARGIRGPASNGPGDHAVGVDCGEFENDEFVFNEFGSWGLANGEDGYAKLTWRRHLATTVNYHAFYLIRAASDDPLGDNPQI